MHVIRVNLSVCDFDENIKENMQNLSRINKQETIPRHITGKRKTKHES